MPIELKICGINSQNIIEVIVKNGGCKYLGFIFYPPSPRNVSIEQSKKLTSIIPSYMKKVAVLVKPENSFVEKIKDQFDYLQLYETPPSKVQEIKLISSKKIIQAIKVKKDSDVDSYKQYIGIADNFLFDSPFLEKSSKFNWDCLKNIAIKGERLTYFMALRRGKMRRIIEIKQTRRKLTMKLLHPQIAA